MRSRSRSTPASHRLLGTGDLARRRLPVPHAQSRQLPAALGVLTPAGCSSPPDVWNLGSGLLSLMILFSGAETFSYN